MSEVFDLKARLEADASPFERAMDASASSTSSALQSIAAAANIYIGKTVVSAFSKAMDKAFEFGQVMADISSISDVSISKLSANIRQLDNVYGSMSSVGNSIYNIISSGFDRSESELMEMVTTVGQASKSIRAELYATANVFTTVANAYHLSSNQFKDIADMLFVTVKEGKAEGNELARTLGLVVNTASEAGLSLAEVSAVIATLSRTQTTSQAMIGFNQMLNAIIKPSQEARTEAERWGIELGASALKTKGFTAIIKEMHDKLQGNAEAINKISGPIRAMRAVISLTGKQYDEFINILEEAESKIGAGVAMDAFVKQTATAEQALKNLRVQYEKTLIDVVQGAEPVLVPILKGIESALKAFSGGNHIVRDVVKAVGDTKGEVDGITQGIDLFVSGLSRINIYFVIITSAIRTVRQTIKRLSTIANSLTATADAIKSNVSTTNSLLSDSAKNTDRIVVGLNNATNAAMRFNKALGSANATIGNMSLHGERLHRAIGLTPDQQSRAIHASYYMTSEQIQNQARRNFEATHVHVGKNSWKDVYSGLFASPKKWIANEEIRIRAELNKVRNRLLAEEQARNVQAQALWHARLTSRNDNLKNDAYVINSQMSSVTAPLQTKWHQRFGATMQIGMAKVGDAFSKGAAALYKGFNVLSQVLLAWDIGTFIGNTIREVFGTDDMFVRREDKQVLDSEESSAIVAARSSSSTLLTNALKAKKITVAEYDAYISRLNKAVGLNDARAVNQDIVNRLQEIDSKGNSIQENDRIANALNTLKQASSSRNTKEIDDYILLISNRLLQSNPDLDSAKILNAIRHVIRDTEMSDDDVRNYLNTHAKFYRKNITTWDKVVGWNNEIGNAIWHTLSLGFGGDPYGSNLADAPINVSPEYIERLIAERSALHAIMRKNADENSKAKANYNAQYEKLKSFLSYTDKFDPFTMDTTDAVTSYTDYLKRIANVSERLTNIKNAIEQTERGTLAHATITGLKVYYENLVKEMKGSVSISYNESTIRDIIKQVQDTLFSEGLIPGTQEYVDKYTKILQSIIDEMPTEGGEQFEAFRTQLAHQITEEVTKAKTNLSDNVLKSLKDHVDNTLKDTEDSVILGTRTEEESLNIQIKTLEDAINSISNLKDVDTDDAKRLSHDYKVSIAKFKKRLTEVHNNIADTALNNLTKQIEDEFRAIDDDVTLGKEDTFDAIKYKLGTVEYYIATLYDSLSKYGVSEDDMSTLKHNLEVQAAKLNSELDDSITELVNSYFDDYRDAVSDLDEQLQLKLITPETLYNSKSAQLAALYNQIETDSSLTDDAREEGLRAIDREVSKLDAEYNDYLSDEASYRGGIMQSKFDAGMVTESELLQFELKVAREAVATASSWFNKTTESSSERYWAERDLEKATISLAKAFKNLEDNAIAQRNAVMSQVQTYFKGGMVDNGSLTNNALYHSVNLMRLSRIDGISTVDTPNVQNARQAQTAVARSIDAWVTEQRYSQANIGKTVADIYDYMRDSNIVIGG